MKRVICLTLAVFVLMFSCLTFSASAEETTSTDCIYFQVPVETSVAWNNFSMIFCHIWQQGDEGGDFYAWQSKEERCTDLGNGYWSYDISGFDFKEDGTYSVIFSNENGMQTYNLTLTSACKGDIAVCEGDSCENPVDNSKQCAVARWMQNGDTVHPSAEFGSDGDMLDPDDVFNTGIDLKWGSSEGTSIVMPEVEVPTEPQTEAATEAEETATESDAQTILSPLWIIIGAVAILLIVAVIVVVVVKRTKKS